MGILMWWLHYQGGIPKFYKIENVQLYEFSYLIADANLVDRMLLYIYIKSQ